MANKIILAWIVISLALPAMAWNEFKTTFRIGRSDTPPKTENEAREQGWQKLSDCHSDKRFAGSRWLQYVEDDTMVPDKIMIYDTDGQMAGMQSLVPIEDFVGIGCDEKKYYLKETINSKEYCVTTMYFTDPTFICGKVRRRPVEDQLFIQNGAGYKKKNLTSFPKTYGEAMADPNHWHKDKFFPLMGHHTTSIIERDICGKAFMPIQGLYAWLDGECRNTGFVWTHLNTKTPDTSGWEKPSDRIAGLFLRNVPECISEAAKEKHVTTMHVFLGGSTKCCDCSWWNPLG